MSGGERTRADDVLMLALACGATVEGAARKAGVSERTAYRRLDEPGFRAQLNALRSQMVERAAGMLTAGGMESVKTLVSLQEASMPAAARLGAAKATLELGLKLRQRAELEERLAALEERLIARNDRG